MLIDKVVPQFLERFPEMEVDLVVEGRLVDIVKDGFDAGVRLREAVPQDMITVPIGGDARFVAVASPTYLSGRKRPTTPDDLGAHRCIRQRLPSGKRYRWEFEKNRQEIAIDVPGPLTLDSTVLIVEAAVGGLGVGYVPEYTIRPHVDDGRLIVLLSDLCPPLPGLCLYYSSARHVPAGLRVFIEILRECS